jgi:short-subunit dehydrogenase
MAFDYANSEALVTGASRGIGASLARELAARGIRRLILVARSKDDLEQVAQEIWEAHETPVEVIAADLSDEDAPDAVFAECMRRGVSVDLLVNNAGFGSHGYFDTLSEAKEQDMVAVNVASLVALTRLFLPGMVERGWGGVLNVGSTAGFMPIPFMATYGATKAFVQSFSEALWAENRERGNDVRIVCLCPGGTETNFGDGMHRGHFEEMINSTPEEVAMVGLDALERGAPYAVVGGINYAASLLPRVLPRGAMARLAALIVRPLPSADAASRTKSDKEVSDMVKVGAAALAGVATLGLAAFAITRAVNARNGKTRS